MDATLEHETSGHKIQRKLAESRFFIMSLTIHILLVVFAGGVILYKAATEPPDFVAEGGDGLIANTESLAPAEQPQETVPVESVQTQAPDISSPTLDVISSSASTNTFKVAASTMKINVNATGDIAKTTGTVVKGVTGGVGGLPGSMKGRMGSGRAKAMADNKMKDATERAVIRGLEWLKKVQNADGSWGEKNKGAMTGFALLCFLGHGETNESPNYGLTVNKAVQWILDTGTKFEGRLCMAKAFSQPGVYEHGICTYALGEYYTMTKDERVVELLKQAVGHIIQGQSAVGGWFYSYDKTKDDLSVSGWQIQALKAAHLTGLNLPGVDGALDKASECIEKFWKEKGEGLGYGYWGAGRKYSLTGVGILCRLFWGGDHGDVKKPMEWVLDETDKNKPKELDYKSDKADLYAWYYHTQAALMFGGTAWQKWNRWFQDEIVGVQEVEGSWPEPGGKGHGMMGAGMSERVYRSCLCILMLEVYYRYMPSNKVM